jgi:hypothetical protein
LGTGGAAVQVWLETQEGQGSDPAWCLGLRLPGQRTRLAPRSAPVVKQLTWPRRSESGAIFCDIKRTLFSTEMRREVAGGTTRQRPSLPLCLCHKVCLHCFLLCSFKTRIQMAQNEQKKIVVPFKDAKLALVISKRFLCVCAGSAYCAEIFLREGPLLICVLTGNQGST